MDMARGVGKSCKTLTDLWRMLLAVLGSLMLIGQFGHAAMLKMSLEHLAKTADTVVYGTVVRQVSAWDAHHTAIHTDVTVAVKQAIVGTPEPEVTFRVMGGMVGGMGMRTSVDATFHDGEVVIVFLDMLEAPGSVVGMHQGKITVQENMVRSDGQLMSVDDFIASIRTAVR